MTTLARHRGMIVILRSWRAGPDSSWSGGPSSALDVMPVGLPRTAFLFMQSLDTSIQMIAALFAIAFGNPSPNCYKLALIQVPKASSSVSTS